MRDPRESVRALIQRGRWLQQEAASIRQSVRGLPSGAGAARSLLTLFGVPRQRALVSLGKFQYGKNLQARSANLDRTFNRWFDETLVVLRGISVARRNLTNRGNSAVLSRRFSRAKRKTRLDSQISASVGELETILEEDLVFNEDIGELLKSRKREAMDARHRAREQQLLDIPAVSPGLEGLRFANREQLREAFGTHAGVATLLEGAIDAHFSGGADAFGQALSSCRKGLELVVCEISGQSEWRAGLGGIAEGSRKKMISDLYGFLSGYGSHSGGVPRRHDAELGIRQTIAVTLWLISHANEVMIGTSLTDR